MSIGFYIILHHPTLHQELPKISLYALSFSPGGFLWKASCHKWEAILFHHLPSTKFLVFSKFLTLAFPKLSNKKQVSTFNVLYWMIFDCVTDTCVFSQGILMCLIHRMRSHPFLTNNSRTKTCHHRDLWWSVSRSGEKKMPRFRLMVSQNLENVWSFFRKSAKKRWFSSPTWQDSYPPPHHPHLMLTVVRREDVPCTRGVPGDTCRFIPGDTCRFISGDTCRFISGGSCSGILGGVSRDTSEPKPLLIATLRRDFSLNDTLSRCCALAGPQRWLMHRNMHRIKLISTIYLAPEP